MSVKVIKRKLNDWWHQSPSRVLLVNAEIIWIKVKFLLGPQTSTSSQGQDCASRAWKALLTFNDLQHSSLTIHGLLSRWWAWLRWVLSGYTIPPLFSGESYLTKLQFSTPWCIYLYYIQYSIWNRKKSSHTYNGWLWSFWWTHSNHKATKHEQSTMQNTENTWCYGSTV